MIAAAAPVEATPYAAGTPYAERCGDPECAAGGDHGEPWRCLRHRKRRDKRGRKVPCRGTRVAGAKCCRMHGMNEPARKSARQRLLEAADPAAALLVRTIEEADSKNILFHPSVLKAIGMVLDRAGCVAVSRVELEQVEARRLDVYVDAVVGIIRRTADLLGLDLRADHVRSAVGQATKEWAAREAGEEPASPPRHRPPTAPPAAEAGVTPPPTAAEQGAAPTAPAVDPEPEPEPEDEEVLVI